MLKQTIAAVAVSTAMISGAAADDMMMMNDGLQDRNNISVNYTDIGKDYTKDNYDLINNFDNDNVTLGIDGRNGIIEYAASIKEEDFNSVDNLKNVSAGVDTELSLGLALPVSKSLGVVAGVSKDYAGHEDAYLGAIYEKGRIEARYTYQQEAEDHKVSGRLYLNDRYAINAGVQFDEFDKVGDDSTYTVGLSYKF